MNRSLPWTSRLNWCEDHWQDLRDSDFRDDNPRATRWCLQNRDGSDSLLRAVDLDFGDSRNSHVRWCRAYWDRFGDQDFRTDEDNAAAVRWCERNQKTVWRNNQGQTAQLGKSARKNLRWCQKHADDLWDSDFRDDHRNAAHWCLRNQQAWNGSGWNGGGWRNNRSITQDLWLPNFGWFRLQ